MYSYRDKSILISDDDSASQLLMKKYLEKTGAHLYFANDGSEAIDVVLNQKIDIVLMDINMPNINGIEATKKIKTIKNDLPIIIQTAYAIQSDKEEALKAGADDVITKPLDQSRLIDKINYFMLKNSKLAFLGNIN